MKNYLLTMLAFLALSFGAIGQTTLIDFESVNPYLEPFNIQNDGVVANPDATGINTSDSAGMVTKIIESWGDFAFWGGVNYPLGGEISLSGGEQFSVDFYTDAPIPDNDTIMFTLEFKNMYDGSVASFQSHAYYMETGETTNNTWKTLTFTVPADVSGIYDHMVIFFGWWGVPADNVVYYDNIVAPSFTAYGSNDVTFNITDKFNNAEDVKLFIDGTEATLTQTNNVYTNTTALSSSYSVLTGGTPEFHEIVYSYMANETEQRDTTNLLTGAAQEVKKLIIVEAIEDGTATAVSVGDTPPTIDGTIDAVWDNAKTHTLQQRSWWGSPTGLYAQWKVMWDVDNVYLLYVIEDATLVAVNTTDVWKNDCVETFFDMDQSASDGYDANDWQIRTIRNSDIWSGSENVDDTWAADVDRAQVQMDGNVGYVIEMAIPWTSLSSSFLPLDGSEFNYECVAADVTGDGGARTYREAWTSTEDNAYQTTVNFGTITLSDETSEFTSVENVMQVPNLSVYPNPVIDRLNIQAGLPIAEVEIYDIMGRKTSSKTNINKTSFVISTDKLDKNAIYIVKITDVKGNVSARKITVK